MTTLEISYSKISTYEFCPNKYFLIYEKNQRLPPNPHLSLGQSVHRALEAYHKAGTTSEDALLEALDSVWVNEGFACAQETVEFYELAQTILRNYFQFAQERKTQILHLEKDFRLEIAPDLFLRGIIDRIDQNAEGQYEIIDYKTHKQKWSQERLASDLQLTLYAIGAERVLKLNQPVLSYLFLAQGDYISVQRTQEEQEKALERVRFVAEQIRTQVFTPKTENCKYCDFKLSCRFSEFKQRNPQ